MKLKFRLLALAPLMSLVGLGLQLAPARAEAPPRRLPELAAPERPAPAGLRTAVFSGGCFWGVQGVFSHVRGVRHAVAGYTGGAALTAKYEVVSTGLTGHAEAVRVTYDPREVSYGQLLRVFFSVVLDPTEVDRQGPDDGSQYRSVLWTADADQRREAQAYIRQLGAAHDFPAPIATRVQAIGTFYPAEGYHQDFLARHPDHPYIQAWDLEKVEALKALYPALYVARSVRET